MTHNRCLRKQMAQQMFLMLTIETGGFDPYNRNRWQTGWRQPAYGFDPYNRNRWPHNSRATTFCHAWLILLFVPGLVVIPLLASVYKMSKGINTSMYKFKVRYYS